jgi:hypothetical protein
MAGFLKRKKEAKKEKRVKMWITLRVTHILTRQTNNNNNIFIFKKTVNLFQDASVPGHLARLVRLAQ